MGMILSMREEAQRQMGGEKVAKGPDVLGMIAAHAKHTGKKNFSLNEVM